MSSSDKDKLKSGMKNIPKDGQVVMAMMKEMGINECEPKTVVQLCEFVYRYATSVLDEARMFANGKKKSLDVEDVRLAIQLTNESSFTTPPPRDIIIECAHVKNYTPLQPVKSHCGLRLPPDRYCLSQCNFAIKQNNAAGPKKVKTNYVVTGATTGLKISTKPVVSYIKRSATPGGVATKQTVVIPKPKITTNFNLQKHITKPKLHLTQNAQIQMSHGMSTSSDLSSDEMAGLKRKREEEEDEAEEN